MEIDQALAAMIDHTLLRPDATAEDILRICREARCYGFASVCVNPYWVAPAAAELAGSGVKVSSVAGFPLGAHSTAVKAAEAEAAARAGAREIDMVLNIGELKGGNPEAVRRDIAAVVDSARGWDAAVKVILETCLLDDAQKVQACLLAREAGAAFVKTSTGFAAGGATAADVALMRRTVGTEMGVKASGGIRTLQDVRAMLTAGANRIGTSSGVKIIQSTAH